MGIVEDKREIYYVWSENEEVGARVGLTGVTKIVAYYESNSQGTSAWFEVWKGDVLSGRLNSEKMVDVAYKE